MSFQFSSVKCAFKYCMLFVKVYWHLFTSGTSYQKLAQTWNHIHQSRVQNEFWWWHWNILFHFCNKWGSLYVIFGMKIHLVSLIMVQGLWLYKRHFAFSFSKSIFVLKSPRSMLLPGHAVQQEPCQHPPLQGVARWQHRSYGRTFCLA